MALHQVPSEGLEEKDEGGRSDDKGVGRGGGGGGGGGMVETAQDSHVDLHTH